MGLLLHHQKNLTELEEVLEFRRSQRISLEERIDDFAEVLQPEDVVNEQVLFMVIAPAISVDAPATKEVLQQFKNVNTSFTLDYCEPRLHLPTQRHRLISLNWATEAPFSVDEADDPLLYTWPFLLIARTDRFVTAIHGTQPIEEV